MSAARLERGAVEDSFRVVGELSLASVPALDRGSEGLFSGRRGCLEIDLGGVSRSDSAGLALLIEWVRRARAAGQQIRFSHIPEQMCNIIRVSGLDSVLPFEKDEKA